MFYLVTSWTCLLPAILVPVNTLSRMLGVLGACSVTRRLLGAMLIWIALLTPATFARLVGLPLGSLLLLALGPGRLALAVASHRRRPAAV